jgi:hypothetical protein
MRVLNHSKVLNCFTLLVATLFNIQLCNDQYYVSSQNTCVFFFLQTNTCFLLSKFIHLFKETKIFKCVVRVVAVEPSQVENFYCPIEKKYRMRLTLEDPTSRIYAFVFDKDGVRTNFNFINCKLFGTITRDIMFLTL